MSSNNNNVLSLENKKPLTYLLEYSHLQDHLSYVDDENVELKGKVAYMIKLEQKEHMQSVNPYSYIDELKVPSTPFVNSEKFMKQLQRVRKRVQTEDETKESKKKLPQIDQQKLSKGKLSIEALKQVQSQINSAFISYGQSVLKNVNLETGKMFSPLLLKELMQSLEIEKKILKEKIEREREEISEINRLRKYEQLEAREKEDIIEQRIRLMINKRRKLD